MQKRGTPLGRVSVEWNALPGASGSEERGSDIGESSRRLRSSRHSGGRLWQIVRTHGSGTFFDLRPTPVRTQRGVCRGGGPPVSFRVAHVRDQRFYSGSDRAFRIEVPASCRDASRIRAKMGLGKSRPMPCAVLRTLRRDLPERDLSGASAVEGISRQAATILAATSRLVGSNPAVARRLPGVATVTAFRPFHRGA